MPDPSQRYRDAVNKIFDDPSAALAADERDAAPPDDEAVHDRWLRDNIPPHHD